MWHHISDALKHVTQVLVTFGPLGVFVLGLLDSVGIPLYPAMDALLFFVAWKTPEHAYFCALMATVGSLAGNIGLFWAARSGGRRFVKTAEPSHPQRFRRWFRRYGLVTVFIPAMLPIPLPLKVFVISAGVMHTPFTHFAAVILLARVVHYFGVAYIGRLLGEHAQEVLQQHAFGIAGAAVGLALLLVLLIKWNDRRQGDTTEFKVGRIPDPPH